MENSFAQISELFAQFSENAKLQIEKGTEFSGTITAICANPGDTVSEDDVLMKIG